MKITAIQTLIVNARKIETDQAGLPGWGEATLEWQTKGVAGGMAPSRAHSKCHTVSATQ